MTVRPNVILAATSGSVPLSQTTGTYSLPGLNTSSHAITSRRRRCLYHPRRAYATAISDEGDDKPNADRLHEWPKSPKGHPCPTPYQIFALKRHEVYTKARYYELVKLYHPDRNVSPREHDAVPHSIKLDRYRLIVAAHTILSDPEKRNAYDRFGAGWHGRPEYTTSASRDERAGPFSHNWDGPRDPIWQNATWEDWERFRARNEDRAAGVNRGQQTPVYLQNVYFISLVFLLAMIGGSMNYSSAQSRGLYFVEQKDGVHDKAAKELRRVRMEKQTMGDRHDRVEWFVRQREATLGVAGSDPEVIRNEMADKVLPRRDVCRSEEVVQHEGT